jgi:hypothetical protein
MIEARKKFGASVCLVTKDSKKPANMMRGTIPTRILSASLAPVIRECFRLKVPGNIKLFPNTTPAVPAITMEEISIVP